MSTVEPSPRAVVVAGAEMTAFGKFLDRSIKSLVGESVQAAIKDAGIATVTILGDRPR
jgi:acetyl-CoA acetyltransferase